MRLAARHVGTLAAIALAQAVAASAAHAAPVFPAEARLVLLRASVKNQRGELVTTLGRDAFTVYEDGRAQAITVFRKEDVPVSVGILIDNSRSMRDKRAGAEAAALAFVRASNPQDEVFVVSFADTAQVDVPLTRDPLLLEAGLKRLDSIGGTALRDAVLLGEDYLETHATRDQKVLLVITDGLDNASSATPEQVRQRAERSEIAVYAVGLHDGKDDSKKARAREALDELTERTGGLACFPSDVQQAGEAVLDLARQIRQRYTIGYVPVRQALDGSYRKLRVVAKGRERLVVRTRAGYRATPRREEKLADMERKVTP